MLHDQGVTLIFRGMDMDRNVLHVRVCFDGRAGSQLLPPAGNASYNLQLGG
jgi:hypothetical protein